MSFSKGEGWLLGVSIAMFGVASTYALMRILNPKPTEQKNRETVTLSKTLSSEGISAITVPMTTKSFYDDTASKANKVKMDSIYSKYKTTIDLIATINKIPPQLITAIIFLESGGKEIPNSSTKIVGLMQLGVNGMTDVITMERKKGNLTEAEKVILKRNLGTTKYNKVMAAKIGDSFLTSSECLKPELNILLGTMLFMLIYDREKKKMSVGRLDRTIIAYNRGFYSKIPDGDTNSLIANSV